MSGMQMMLLGAGGSFSVTGGSTSVSKTSTRLGSGTSNVTTNSATVGTVSGGTAPYSYLWQYVSGDGATPNSSTSSSTTFTRGMFVGVGDTVTETGIYRCRVTDSASAVIYGPNCNVTTTLTETS